MKKLSKRIETGSVPIHPECGHVLMTAVLPNIKAIENSLAHQTDRAAELEAELTMQKGAAEMAAAICRNCTGNPIEAAAIVMAQARQDAAECSGQSE